MKGKTMTRKRATLAAIVVGGGIVVYGVYSYLYTSLIRPESIEEQIDISAAERKGSPTAPITLVVFEDYECPFCAKHATEILPRLTREYIDTGKVQYIFMNFPLPKHLLAPRAAEAAKCAGEQGKFWQMHDLLFRNGQLRPGELYEDATQLGLEKESFRQCLLTGIYRDNIARDHREGTKAGVQGTPTLFLGPTKSPTFEPTLKFTGTVPYRSLQKAIQQLLGSTEIAAASHAKLE